jgi:hypothetical protein
MPRPSWSGIFAVSVSPSFAARTLQIHGATFTSESIIRSIWAWTAYAERFRIDTDQAATQLVRLPAVESASVQVRLPSTVVVTLVEREPKLVWVIGDKRYVVDQDGLIFGLVDGAGNPIPSSAGPLAAPTDVPLATDTPIGSASIARPDGVADRITEPEPQPEEDREAEGNTPQRRGPKAAPAIGGGLGRAIGRPDVQRLARPVAGPGAVRGLGGVTSGPRALGLPVVFDRRATDAGPRSRWLSSTRSTWTPAIGWPG